tara:strand:- start:184884 stop:185384 length:501 start_codon:yes stop_codon:yes gene_type:complete
MSRARELAIKAAKEARGGGNFLAFPNEVLRSRSLAELSPFASKLLLDVMSQWRLGHNGDASISFEKVMRARGWRSKATLNKALKELRASGLIILTRQGSLHICSLYALGWLAIDECGGKLDIQATIRPLNRWKDAVKLTENKTSSTLRVPKPLIKGVLATLGVPAR